MTTHHESSLESRSHCLSDAAHLVSKAIVNRRVEDSFTRLDLLAAERVQGDPIRHRRTRFPRRAASGFQVEVGEFSSFS